MNLVDLVLHLDVHLVKLVAEYGIWVYGILFAIIFSETGFVVTPFLPGDSLLFVAGAVAAAGEGLNVHLLFVVLALAAFGGNSVNYAIGAVAWVGSLSYAGFFFGNIPWIKGNLTAIILGIVVVSVLPIVIAWLRHRRASR